MNKNDAALDCVREEETPTKRLFRFLGIVRNRPREFATWDGMSEVLKSQGALANFQEETLGIQSCSLNTLKSRAQAELVGGWQSLDYARRKANEVFGSTSCTSDATSLPGRGTKAQLEQRLAELNLECMQLRTDNWQLIKAVRRLLSNAESLMEQFSNEALVKQIKTERAEVLAMFDFLNRPVVRHDATKKE